jgi:hypothetical protein
MSTKTKSIDAISADRTAGNGLKGFSLSDNASGSTASGKRTGTAGLLRCLMALARPLSVQGIDSRPHRPSGS